MLNCAAPRETLLTLNRPVYYQLFGILKLTEPLNRSLRNSKKSPPTHSFTNSPWFVCNQSLMTGFCQGFYIIPTLAESLLPATESADTNIQDFVFPAYTVIRPRILLGDPRCVNFLSKDISSQPLEKENIYQQRSHPNPRSFLLANVTTSYSRHIL